MEMMDYMRMQRQLQIGMKEANPEVGGDPFDMDSEELAVFITWNHTALIKELGEAMDEVGWKPWASSRHIDAEAAIHEMVDAWHFFLNMMLAISAWSMNDLSSNTFTLPEASFEFARYYREKNQKNLQRQKDGYDGVSEKCPQCKREKSLAVPLTVIGVATPKSADFGDMICPCGYNYGKDN